MLGLHFFFIPEIILRGEDFGKFNIKQRQMCVQLLVVCYLRNFNNPTIVPTVTGKILRTF